MQAGLLAELFHPVAQRVPVDTEAFGRLRPAAAGVQEGREGLEQPEVVGRIAEHAVDVCLERGAGQAEQKLERAEVAVGGDR